VRIPNARLRSLREQVPLTQAELAERVGVAELTVRRWETEGLRPQPAHVRSLCSALNASPAELGYGTDDPAPTEPGPDTPLDEPPNLLALHARALVDTQRARATHPVLKPGSTLGAGRSLGESVGSSPYTGTWGSPPPAGFDLRGVKGNVLMGVADESARFLRDTEASRIGSLTLEQLEADLRWLARAYLNQPLGELFFPTVQLRDVAFALVERNRYPEQARYLYLITGQACLLLAQASKEFGSAAAAESHARTAWLCAELADHHDLRAWVRATQGMIAYWEGRPADSVRLVEDGQRFGAQGAVTVLLPSLQARAAGQLSDARTVTAALGAAADAGQQVQPDDLAGGIFGVPPGEQALFAAEARLGLGEGRQAEQHAQDAIASYQAVSPEDLFLGNLHAAQCALATALLIQVQLEGMQQALRPFLDTPPQHRSMPLIRRVLTLDRGLLAHPSAATTPLASQLHDEITEFCAHPLTPQLPTA